MFCPSCGSVLTIKSDNEQRTIYKCLFGDNSHRYFERTEGNLRWLKQWPVVDVPPATEAHVPHLPAEAFVPVSEIGGVR